MGPKMSIALHVAFAELLCSELCMYSLLAFSCTCKKTELCMHVSLILCSLRKVSTNNHHFIGYGSWDSYEDLLDHFESDHSKNFRE